MKKSPRKPARSNISGDYLKYSGLAVQFALTLTILAYGGHLLDNYLSLKHPWFTLLFSVIGIIGLLVKLVKDLSK